MKVYPIFLKPVFKERIWGGTALRDTFNYNIPSNLTGECWGISALPQGKSIVKNGEYAGLTLSEIWTDHRELFGGQKGDYFPLLTKILDANSDLSVQVHPDDEYAQKYEKDSLGKTECWYIIDCKKGAELIYGHTATTKEEFQKRMEQGEWDRLLRKIPIHPGDFFYVPSGTIHALGAGTLVLETQQNSDSTYRVYDYDRKDDQGNKRELHLQKALDVTNIPHNDRYYQPKVTSFEGITITTFLENHFFSVQKWEISGPSYLKQTKDFLLISVIKGIGEIFVNNESYSFTKGDHFILPYGLGKFSINGNAELIVSYK
ncbi:mannose-6-phosphate isomerase, class I [Ectobacillus polymachus]|uniref:mannose-6-phosphate isomerase, class I n=1 Tax=Ectobacillus polymachus TaxID=1508806 RepID=UPI003A89F568